MTLKLGIGDFGRPINPAPRPASGVPTLVVPAAPAAATAGRSTSIRRELRFGGIAFAVFFGIAFVWSSFAEISGAVLAQGILVPETTTKKVQHPTGGIVQAVLAEAGKRVRAGDLLVRLDDTVARANVTILSRQMDELDLRRRRLLAERDGLREFGLSADASARITTDAEYASLVADERRVLELRAEARDGKRQQLRKRIEQTEKVIASTDDQILSKEREVAVIESESDAVGQLFRKNLVNLQRVNQLIRDKTRVEGELAQLRGAKAEAASRIAEYELNILQIEQDLRSEVAGELRDTIAKLAELSEHLVTAQDALAKTEIRAPQDGVVQQLAVRAPGAVLVPNEVVLAIVPTQERLFVDAQVPPNEIDQIHRGQKISLRFAAFNTRTTRTVEGEILDVSPDRVADPRDPRLSYYQIRIGFEADAEEDRRTMRLIPGMAVECYATTEKRTVLSYVLKPFSDQAARAFIR